MKRACSTWLVGLVLALAPPLGAFAAPEPAAAPAPEAAPAPVAPVVPADPASPSATLAPLPLDLADAVAEVLRLKPPVVRIDVTGLFRVSPESVKSRLQTRIGRPLDRGLLSEDVKRVYNMDFFDDVAVRAHPEGDGLALVFVVRERPTINSLRFEGYDEVDLEDIQKVVDIRQYGIVNVPQIQANIQKIKDLYVEEGFYLAEVAYTLIPLPENMVDLVFVIHERSKVKVKSITILGNENVPDDDLKKVLRTREGDYLSFLTKFGQFKRDAFEEDLRAIQQIYAMKGYVTARVDDPVVTLSRDGEFMYITIPVVEGERYKVSEVKLTGELGADEEELTKQLKLKPGEIFNALTVHLDTVMLADHFKDQGYAYCSISNAHRLDRKKRLIGFSYVVQRGPKVHFGRITLRGNATTRDLVIRRELKIAEGDLYSETGIKRSKAMVQRLGFFERVEITTQPGAADDLIDAVVEVAEKETGTFQVGAGFSSLESFIATAQVSKDNFLGRGQTVSFQAMISSIRTMFNVSFFEPYFFDTPLTFSTELYNFEYQYSDFTRGSTGGSMTWGYRFLDDFTVSLGYKLENVDVSQGGQRGSSAVNLRSLFNDGLTSSLTASFAYDTRDNRLFPTNGWYASASVEHADWWLGSDNQFTRILLRGRRYFPLWWKTVLKFNLNIGYIFSYREPVAIYERFFVGGIFTVRGFDRFSLGPRMDAPTMADPATGTYGFVKGGNKQLYFNAEYEIPIFEEVGIKAVVFFDAGNAFDDGEIMNPLDLRTSAGFGIRWWSPVGPLRFEWGFPLKPKPGEDPYVFEFTIGNAF